MCSNVTQLLRRCIPINQTFCRMVKRKATKQEKASVDLTVPPAHSFSEKEIKNVRKELLGWYNTNKRDLPWRKQANNTDINQRSYAVWVSEIMLQQTQVATVIDYYNKWMKKWPTVQDLAKASLEEVNEMWSGLGYYSRGRRLHEGAQKVVDQLDGLVPSTAESLIRELPGVGRYTAGAIASIAFNEVTGLVDGNVIRVLSRLRMIGADTNSQAVTAAMWELANALVDTESPGDFNQGMMELGATVCVPKGPSCSTCPLRQYCKAYAQVEQGKDVSASKLGKKTVKHKMDVLDIECLADSCSLCLPASEVWDTSDGVMNYPRKGKKKAAREERTAVCVLCRKSEGTENTDYFIVQRPKTGLLAGLWEFPSLLLNSDGSPTPSQCLDIMKTYGILLDTDVTVQDVGEVVHIFSHIHQTYCVSSITLDQSDIEIMEDSNQASRWVTKQQFMEAAVSTGMKKVFKTYETGSSSKAGNKKSSLKAASGNQRSIASFFKPKVST